MPTLSDGVRHYWVRPPKRRGGSAHAKARRDAADRRPGQRGSVCKGAGRLFLAHRGPCPPRLSAPSLPFPSPWPRCGVVVAAWRGVAGRPVPSRHGPVRPFAHAAFLRPAGGHWRPGLAVLPWCACWALAGWRGRDRVAQATGQAQRGPGGKLAAVEKPRHRCLSPGHPEENKIFKIFYGTIKKE